MENGHEVTKDESPCNCYCKSKLDPYQIFDDNVEDIARSLSQIMLICGINTVKSHRAKSLVKRVFVYHETLRTKCTSDKSNRLGRDDLLQALRMKCEMKGVEALLVYAIIKRAFKAFFHGKCPYTVSNPINDALAIHSQEGAWKHAAYRTARIFDNYRAAFFWAHKSYEKQIKIVYEELFKRMKIRADPLKVPMCPCKGCKQRKVVGGPKPGKLLKEKPFKVQLNECGHLPEPCVICGLQVPKMICGETLKMPRPITNHELKLERCEQCKSPRLICECHIDPMTGAEFGECGQDSYKVKWYRVEDEQLLSEEEAEECATDWENHHCPIDCRHDSDPTEADCGQAGQDGSDDDTDVCADRFESCDEENDVEDGGDALAKLEAYLNKLWAEEVATKKNPKTYVPMVPRTSNPCQKCG